MERELAAPERSGLSDTDFAMTAVHNVASTLMGFGEVNSACAREKDLVTRLQATDRTIITAMAVLYGTCFLKAGQPAEALAWYDKGLSAAQNEDDVTLQIHARWNRARALIDRVRVGFPVCSGRSRRSRPTEPLAWERRRRVFMPAIIVGSFG